MQRPYMILGRHLRLSIGELPTSMCLVLGPEPRLLLNEVYLQGSQSNMHRSIEDSRFTLISSHSSM